MRILHMTPELPYEPGGGGGRGREYFFCRRMVELGHDVLNISPVLPAEARHADILRGVGVENWVAVRPASHVREAAAAVIAEPGVLLTAMRAPVRALEMRIFWIAIRELTARAVREWRPDVVVIGHDMAAAWATELPPELPAVLTLHNLTWHWYLSRAQRRSGIQARLLRAEAARYERHLLRLLPRFSAAVAVSTLEAEELRRKSDVPVSVIPTGVDTDFLTATPDPGGPPRVVFTGSLGYPPNHQGIQWFVDRVWPAIRREIPEVSLDIVGRDPPPSVQALGGRPGVTVVGPVPEMGPYFERAHAVVVPILTGAGIRVKIVEAMAAGRPIVSTTLGWEGLPGVVPGRDLLVADAPQQFATEVVRLLGDRELRRTMGATARSLAVEQYDWRRLGDEQAAVLAHVLKRDNAPVSPTTRF